MGKKKQRKVTLRRKKQGRGTEERQKDVGNRNNVRVKMKRWVGK